MKKKIIIFLIVVIVIVIALISSGIFEKFLYKYIPPLYGTLYRDGLVWDPVKDGDKFLNYQSDAFGVSFDYPLGYVINDEPRGEEGLSVIADIAPTVYVKSPYNKYTEGMIIVEIQLSQDDVNKGLDNIVSLMFESYADYDVQEVERGEVSIDGNDGEYIVYNVNDRTNGERTSKEFFVIRNNKLYHFTFTDSGAEYQDSIKLFDKVVESFKFN